MSANNIAGLLGQRMPELSSGQLEKMGAYYKLVCDANERVNLTAVTAPAEAADKHFVDSLLASAYIPAGADCVDVGTGAGFPGVPLMIARSDIKMTLIDSLQKRVRFLEEATAAIGLAPDIAHLRAEDAGHNPQYRERFGIALSRAVAPLNIVLELTSPLVRVGGSVLAYKGKTAYEELEMAGRAADILRLRLEVIELEQSYGVRRLIRGVKLDNTPARYPRKAGEPSRKPL